MAKYIDIEKEIKTIRQAIALSPNKAGADLFEGLIEIWESIPPADVVEVKHGKWICDKKVLTYNDFYCSECRKYTETRNPKRLNSYCGFCGAKMGGIEAK